MTTTRQRTSTLAGRVWAVATTYFNRRGLWIVMTGVLACMTAAYFEFPTKSGDVTRLVGYAGNWYLSKSMHRNPSSSSHFDRFIPPAPGLDWPQLRSLKLYGADDALLPAQMRHAADLRELELHNIPGVDSQLTHKSPLPKDPLAFSESIKRWSHRRLQPQDLEVISTHSLNRLELQNCRLAKNVLRAFGQRFPIRYLTVDRLSLGSNSGDFAQNLDELSSFLELEHLELHGLLLTTQIIDLAMRLPNLRVLVVDDCLYRGLASSNALDTPLPGWTTSVESDSLVRPTTADLQRLTAHPTLKWVYADWHKLGITDSQAFQELQPIWALPISTSSGWYARLTWSFMASVFLFAILLRQLYTHYSLPSLLATPHFEGAHWIVAALIATTGCLVMLYACFRSHIHPLPGLTVYVACPLFCALAIIASRVSRTSLTNPMRSYFLAYLLLLLFFMSHLVLLSQFPSWYYAYWQGYLNWIALIVLSLECVLIARFVGWLRSTARVLAEGGADNVNEATQTWHPAIVKHQVGTSESRGLIHWLSTCLQKTADQRDWKWHQYKVSHMAALWYNSLPQSIYRTTAFFLMPILITGIIWELSRIILLSPDTVIAGNWRPSSGLALGIIVAASMTMNFGLTYWSVRLQHMSCDILRPVKRTIFVQAVFLAYLRSIGPVLMVPLVILLYGILAHWAWSAIAMALLWTLGNVALSVAMGSMMFAYFHPQNRLAAFVLHLLPLAALVAPSLALSFVFAQHLWGAVPEKLAVILNYLGIIGVGLMAIAALTIGFAYQRTFNREWDLR
ncbi:MAG: hypothetical protein KF752_07435 [Pirellulaceae bacterium]|nr:hypothetical protein [Pirellulaceae bacterium]